MVLDLYGESLGDESLPSFIILHGLFGSGSNWRSIARKLSDRFRVTCLDLRNHGRSPWSDEMTYLDMAGDVVHYLQVHGVKKPVILGHSMGGKTVMAMHQEFGYETSITFVADIAPVRYNHNHDHLITAMRGVDFDGVTTRNEIESQLVESIPQTSLRQFLMQNLRWENNRFNWRVNLDSISRNSLELFDYPSDSVSNSEIVFIAGGQSDYLAECHLETIHTFFPRARHEVVEDAGHWLHAEKPARFLEIVNSYLHR